MLASARKPAAVKQPTGAVVVESPPPLAPLTRFIMDDSARYQRWRAQKLRLARRYWRQPLVEIDDPAHLSRAELSALRARVAAMNFALYRVAGEFGRREMGRLCAQVDLRRLAANPGSASSGISEIRVTDDARRDYIPYTNRALNWHTDGYYNPPGRRIRAFAMHTVRAAANGGENRFLDHEILYLLLRDQAPALAACLFAEDVMGIPPAEAIRQWENATWNGAARRESTGETMNKPRRPAQIGPVFSFQEDGRLHLRFTLRQRHIAWKPCNSVGAALAEIRAILADPNNPFILTRRLQAGEGVICNNVLHSRAAFTDGGDAAGQPAKRRTEQCTGRLVLRARFYDRIGIAPEIQLAD